MLGATKDRKLVTAMVGSFPRPTWFTENLHGRNFREAMADSLYREQYLDALACYISEQERAGLDILTDGDARFDLEVGGRSWFFYVLERLGGLGAMTDAAAFREVTGARPGQILFEVHEALQAPTVTGKIERGSLQYAAMWKTAQKMSSKPIKFGAITGAPLTSVMRNEFYPNDQALMMDLAAALNEELLELDAAGCPIIQIEEPTHHIACISSPPASEKELEFLTAAFNREVRGLKTEIWAHTCWGNPNQQSFYWERPSYERSIPYLLSLDADVVMLECSRSLAKDLGALDRIKTDKKIAIGVVDHTNTTVEPAEMVATTIRNALKHVPPERLIVTSDCGFGREGMSRRIAFYKCVSLVQGTNIVRRELGLPEAEVRAADPRFALD